MVSLPFATNERHDVIALTRFMGLALNLTLYDLAAMPANIRRDAKFYRFNACRNTRQHVYAQNLLLDYSVVER